MSNTQSLNQTKQLISERSQSQSSNHSTSRSSIAKKPIFHEIKNVEKNNNSGSFTQTNQNAEGKGFFKQIYPRKEINLFSQKSKNEKDSSTQNTAQQEQQKNSNCSLKSPSKQFQSLEFQKEMNLQKSSSKQSSEGNKQDHEQQQINDELGLAEKNKNQQINKPVESQISKFSNLPKEDNSCITEFNASYHPSVVNIQPICQTQGENQFNNNNQLGQNGFSHNLNSFFDNQQSNNTHLQNIQNFYLSRDDKKNDKLQEDKEKIIELENKNKNQLKEIQQLTETINNLKENQEHEFQVNLDLKQKLINHQQLQEEYLKLEKKYQGAQEIIDKLQQKDEISLVEKQIQANIEIAKYKKQVDSLLEKNQNQIQRISLLDHELKTYKIHLETLRQIEINHQAFVDNLTNLEGVLYQRNDEIQMLRNLVQVKDNTIYQLDYEKSLYLNILKQKNIEIKTQISEPKQYINKYDTEQRNEQKIIQNQTNCNGYQNWNCESVVQSIQLENNNNFYNYGIQGQENPRPECLYKQQFNNYDKFDQSYFQLPEQDIQISS